MPKTQKQRAVGTPAITPRTHSLLTAVIGQGTDTTMVTFKDNKQPNDLACNHI